MQNKLNKFMHKLINENNLCDLRPLLSCCRWTEGLLGPGLLLQRGLCSEPILSDRAGPRRNPPPETKA